MSPWELFVDASAIAGSFVVLALGLGLGIIIIKSALKSAKKEQ